MTGPDRPAADALFLAEVLAPTLAFLRRSDGVRRAARRARGRPAGAGRGAPADQRARRPGRRPVRPVVPRDDGRRHGGDRPGRDQRHARAGVAGGRRAGAVLGRDRRPRRVSRRAAALLRDVPEPERRAIGPIGLGLPGLQPGAARGRRCDLPRGRRAVAGRAGPRALGDGVGRDADPGRPARTRRSEVLDELERSCRPSCSCPTGFGRPKGMLAEDDDEASTTSRRRSATAVQQGNLVRRGARRGAVGRAAAPGPAAGRGPQPTSSRPSSCCAASGATVLAERATDRAARRRRRRRRGRRVAPAADAARAAGRPAGRRRGVEPRPRRQAVHQPAHRRGPPHGDLPQARRPQPPRAAPLAPSDDPGAPAAERPRTHERRRPGSNLHVVGSGSTHPIYEFDDCLVDPGRFELRRGGAVEHVEPQVFDVLVYLIRHRERVVTKTELLDTVWGDRFVSESALAARLKSARRARRRRRRRPEGHPHRVRARLPVRRRRRRAPESAPAAGRHDGARRRPAPATPCRSSRRSASARRPTAPASPTPRWARAPCWSRPPTG